MNQEIEIGRHGKAVVQEDGSVKAVLEVKRWKEQPKLEQFTGYSHTVTLEADILFRKSTENGYDEYTLRDFGIYLARDAIATSRRGCDVFFRFCDGRLEGLNREQLDAALRAEFPASAQAYDQQVERRNRLNAERKRLEQAIFEEREAFSAVHSEDGYTAIPRFCDIPNDLALREQTEDELIVTYSTPTYVVEKPFFASADTPDKAIRQAREKEQQRRDAFEAAKRLAQQKGWPELSGSPKQIRWAEQIRACCFKAGHASEKELIGKKLARYWIDHYKELAR